MDVCEMFGLCSPIQLDFRPEMQIPAELLCMQVQLYMYCIVTGSCRPFQRTSRMHYEYEWEVDRE